MMQIHTGPNVGWKVLSARLIWTGFSCRYVHLSSCFTFNDVRISASPQYATGTDTYHFDTVRSGIPNVHRQKYQSDGDIEACA
jgi:hypothetical protein